jgi:hypothetical protein
VAGFLAAGGSLTSQWKTLALPILHTTTFSMQIAVVDQVQFEGADTPRSVVLDAAAIDRAAVLGRNVASQLGVAFDQARYLGPPGLCPMCHLDVVALRGANVECANMRRSRPPGPGPEGDLDGPGPVDLGHIHGREAADAAEIQETAKRHRGVHAEIEERPAFEAYDPTVRPEHAWPARWPSSLVGPLPCRQKGLK